MAKLTGRVLTAGVLVASGLVVFPAQVASAEPKPTLSQAQAKLRKLNEKVDKLVDKYNKTDEQLSSAKRKLSAANKALAAEQKKYDEQHEKFAQIATSAYQTGEVSAVTALLAEKDPAKVLDKVAMSSHLFSDRSSLLKEFLASAQRVQRNQAQVQAAHDEVVKKSAELKAQKKAMLADIEKQKKLVRKLGGDPDTSPGHYTGDASGKRRKALQYAFAQKGKPYIYGGTGPRGYDCSGLMMMAWKSAGVNIPRVVPDQASATRRVSYDQLQAGDIVFFNSYGHNGMYIGGGKMIHAPHTGDVVKIVPIGSGYYRSNFMHGGAPV